MSSPDILKFIADRQVKGPFRERLLALCSADVAFVQELINELKPSANWLRAVLTLLEEVSKRDDVPIDLLFSRYLSEILRAERKSRKEKQRLVRDVLEKKRYPIKHELEEKLESLRVFLVKQTGVNIELPANLEGDALKISFKIHSREELLKTIENFKQLSSSAQLCQILELLQGRY